jgi:choice-of-anchor B domain-containing protein
MKEIHVFRFFSFLVVLSAIMTTAFYTGARAQESLNMDLIGQLPIGTGLGDVWVANDVAYLALFGGNGASIVDVSDPANPFELTQYSTPSTAGTWDVKASGNYAYLAPQFSGVGLVTLDVTDPANPVLVSEFSHERATSVHNVWIDTTTAHAYLASNTSGAVEIVDISNPASPQHVASFESAEGSIHDMVVVDGILYASFLSGGLYLADVSDPTNPQLMGFVDYPEAFTHNAWPSEDGRYVFTTDEVNGGHMRVFDVQDLGDIHEVASYQAGPPDAIIHNVHVVGDFVHIAYYSEGYRVVDVTDPLNPIEVGFYDTFSGQSGGFDGAWGVYPFSEFSYVSDIQSGLFVFDFTGGRAATIRGFVREEGSADPIPTATVSIPAEGRETGTESDGSYSLPTTMGEKMIFASAFGFAPESVLVTVDSTGLDLDFDLEAFPTGGITGFVRDRDALPIDATLTLYASSGETFETVTGPQGEYSFSDIPSSNPPHVVYDSLVVRPVLPYVPFNQNEVFVPPNDVLFLDLELWRARVLLVDDDEGDAYESYFLEAIRDAGMGDSTVTFEVPPGGDATSAVDVMDAGDVVVWFSGDATTDILTGADRDRLVEFRGRGGHLFLTGQNFAEDLDQIDPGFLNDVLGVEYDGLSTESILEGIDGDPLGDGLLVLTSGNDGANNQTSRDVLIPLGDANASLEYNASNLAAVWGLDSGSGSRIVFFGFGFEAVNKTSPQSSFIAPEILMGMVLDFLRTGAVGIGPEGGEGGPGLPKAFALGQNYPNPFNPSTAIPFTIPVHNESSASVPVTLVIYDLRGRLVTTLIDREMLPGEYTVHWNGRNSRGARVGSGIYIYRIDGPDFSATRRMVMVK